MPWVTPLMVALAFAPPVLGDEKAIVDVSGGGEVMYPPVHKDPNAHASYGVSAAASIHRGQKFAATFGFGFDHVVNSWLGDVIDDFPRNGTYAGTQPASFRGQFFRMTPTVRIGAQNELAFGYFGVNTGYALRIADLVCVRAPCRRDRAVNHGLSMGLSMGALLAPSDRIGLLVGAEVGLDWAWFPGSHPGLARWNHAMSARAVAGWRF